PLRGVLDLDRENARLEKKLAEVSELVERSRAKLSNKDFIERAPEEIVDRERQRLSDLESEASHLRRRLEEISS
ncbi:MAG: hypothetical protein R6U70_00685, partial [Bacillota bacterium]